MYYLIQGVDLSTFRVFLPDPCLFETEQEARYYIESNKDSNIKLTYREVRLGKGIGNENSQWICK